jgi:hypothetical protein
MIHAAGHLSDPRSAGALAELCQIYWPPLYGYLRGRGYDAEKAQDLTQGFFARFLEKQSVGAADPARGRFRAFLLTALKRFTFNVVGVVPALPQVTAFNSVISDCTIGLPCNRLFGVQNGGSAPFTWNVEGLPHGMDFRWGSGVTSSNTNPTQVELWGTPVEAGLFNVTATITDSTGVKAKQTFQLYVSVLMTTNGLLNGTVETPYVSQVRVIGGSPDYTMSQTGNLLTDGLVVTGATRTVSGTPHESGNFNPAFTFVDSASRTLQVQIFFNIRGAGSGFVNINTNSNLGVITQGAGYNQQLSACCPSVLTEFRQGVPILERVRSGRLDREAAVALLTPLGALTRSAHARGLVHGSIVAGNVIVDVESGRARLLDFGLTPLMASTENYPALAAADLAGFEALARTLRALPGLTVPARQP